MAAPSYSPAPAISPAPAMPAPAITPAPATPEPKKGEKINPPVGKLNAPALIVVTLPAEAKLTIDGAATTSTSARRTFVSPVLNAGAEYHYTLTAEFVQNGKPVTVSKKVAVTAGSESNVAIEAPATVAAY